MGATLQQLEKLKQLEEAQKKQKELKSKNNSEAVDLLKKMLVQTMKSQAGIL